jgi:putative sterol carrier protein
MPDLFSPAGIAAWRSHLDQSDEFHRAAKGWTGAVLLVEGSLVGAARTTWIAIDDGAIIDARPGSGADHDAAEFVLSADADTWAALIAGREELLGAAMRGAMRLERGQVWRLLPHARAASVMLRAAGDKQ